MRFVVTLAAALLLSACQPAEPTTPAAEVSLDAAAQTPAMPADAPPQEAAPGSVTPAPAPSASAREPQARIPEGPDMAPVAVPGGETPCRTAIGEAASARLVQRCIAVSPATRPPCNAINPCTLIQSEIDRSCGQYGPSETRPTECTA